MGGCNTIMIYVFASVAPFVGIQILEASPEHYGIMTLVPAIGFIWGAIFSVRFAHRIAAEQLIKTGVVVMSVGIILVAGIWLLHLLNLWTLFLPMIVVFGGGTVVFATVPSLAVS